MMGLSISGSISLGWALVAGRKRVPRPATGKTALRTLIAFRAPSCRLRWPTCSYTAHGRPPFPRTAPAGRTSVPVKMRCPPRSGFIKTLPSFLRRPDESLLPHLRAASSAVEAWLKPPIAKPHTAVMPFLQGRGFIAQQDTAHDRNRWLALFYEIVVESLQAVVASYLLLVITAQLHDLQLAQGVDQVRWVRGAPLRLALSNGGGLVPFPDEEIGCLRQRHPGGMHLDAHDIAGIAQQRVLQLSDAQFGIAVAIALVEHHLFGVVCPSFDVRAAPNQLAYLRGELLGPQKLHVMPGIGLVNCGAENRTAVKALHPRFRLVRRPGRLRQRHVEECFSRLGFVGSGRVHGSGSEGAGEWRRLLHDRTDVGRDGNDLPVLDETDQTVECVAKTLQ